MNQPLHYPRSRLALLSLVATVLTACGGGAGVDSAAGTNASGGDLPVQATGVASDGSTVVDAAKTLRGTVLSTTATQTLARKYIDKQVSEAEAPLVTNNPDAKDALGNSKCDVDFLRITYSTINPQDAPKSVQATAKASAVLLVPSAKGCPGPWPMLSQQHGTSIGKLAVGQEGVLSMAAYYGSQGYVVVMPDYHGYSDSSLPYHPYLQAEPSAAVVIDAVRAARNWLNSNGYGASLGNKLFLAGTSEGGYVTMAAQRSMERFFPTEFAITAVAPTSGPYQLQATLDSFMGTPDTPEQSKAVGATYIIEGFYQRYGDAYTTPSEAYRAPWASEMGVLPPLLPSTTTSSDGVLRRTCQLPYNLKDPATPDTPTYPGCSSEPLLTAAYVADYLNPNGTGGGARVRVHAGENNLLQNWKPTSKTAVCYGSLDAMATPNAQAAKDYFQAAGSAALLTVEDLETETQPVIAHWMVTQTQKYGPGDGYHGKVEAPACTSWSRYTVFDPLR